MKNNIRNISVGIALLLTITAIISGGMIYRKRVIEKGTPSMVAPDGKVHHTSAGDIEDEHLLIRHNGEAYSMDGNKIIPAN
jgi:hypothetical protein